MPILSRPARSHERRTLHSSVEVQPIRVADGVATVQCSTEILARVAERHGFRRVEAATVPVPLGVASAPALPDLAPDPREVEVDRILDGSVDDLDEALESGRLDDLLAVAYVAERGGKNRVTAKRAIIARSREIGISFDVP